MSEQRLIDYQVTVRMSLGGAEAYLRVMEVLMQSPEGKPLASGEWREQIRRDMHAVQKQIDAQSPELMYAIRGEMFKGGRHE